MLKSLTQQAIPLAVYDDIGIVHSGDIPLKQNAAYACTCIYTLHSQNEFTLHVVNTNEVLHAYDGCQLESVKQLIV